MAHVPHLLIPGPWSPGAIALDSDHRRHLSTVLRREVGSPVSYTDGEGVVGDGTLAADRIERGAEHSEPVPGDLLTLAVAPPDSKDRVRWLVEKCTELGVDRIRWLRTEHGQGRIPRHDKASAWMSAAVEQSRRAWITHIDTDWSTLSDLGAFVAADQSGGEFRPAGSMTIAVGPEGGWSQDEFDLISDAVSVGASVLRTETASIAVAAVFASTRRQ